MRKYKTGTKWCVWRWSEVDSDYLRRLHLIKTPWFSICVHWILKPDPEPYVHDHPVSFLSLILRGGYTEHRVRILEERPGFVNAKVTVPRHQWWNFIRASRQDRHRITSVEPNTVTLCLMGPKTQEWGFYTEKGWVYWRDYYREQRAQRAS